MSNGARMDDDGDGTDGDTSGPVLPEAVLRLDTVYDALAHPTRRAVCYLLSERDRWSLTDLAARVAALEEDVAPSAVDGTARDRASAALHHVHLPWLADLGVVAFDADAGTVSAGPEADRVLAALEATSRLVDDGADTDAEADGEPTDAEADAADEPGGDGGAGTDDGDGTDPESEVDERTNGTADGTDDEE